MGRRKPKHPEAQVEPVEPSARDAIMGRAIDLYLQGNMPSEIALAMGVVHSTVWRWMQSAEWGKAIAQARAERRAAAVEVVDNAALKAVRYLERVLDMPERDEETEDGMVLRGVDPKVKIMAAKELLDRAGWVPPKHEGQSTEALEDRLAAALDRLQKGRE